MRDLTLWCPNKELAEHEMGIKWDHRDHGQMRKISRGLKLQFDEKMEVEKWGTIAGLVVLVGARMNKVKGEEEEAFFIYSAEISKMTSCPHDLSEMNAKSKADWGIK